MNNATKIASCCYLINAVAFLLIGMAFVFGSEFFGFHSDVIQTPWNELNSSVQTLYLGMMRTEGAGFLASAVAIIILFFIPFRRGEIWSAWAMSAIGIVEHLPTLYANVHVSLTTAATPPWPIPLAGTLLLIIGLVCAVRGIGTHSVGS